MKNKRNGGKRNSVRIKGYDYSQAGAYFVTICAHNKECLFGEINDGVIILNDVGKIVKFERLKNQELRHNVKSEEYVIMPNHIHGIIIIEDEELSRSEGQPEIFGKPVKNSLPTIIRSFKSAATRQFNLMTHNPGKRLWQRNYYEHIIRDENDCRRIREYIDSNTVKWELDSLHPNNC